MIPSVRFIDSEGLHQSHKAGPVALHMLYYYVVLSHKLPACDLRDGR